MHRMTGYDAQFIYDEAPNEPQHTLKLLILDETASSAYSFENAKASVGRRLGGDRRNLRRLQAFHEPLKAKVGNRRHEDEHLSNHHEQDGQQQELGGQTSHSPGYPRGSNVLTLGLVVHGQCSLKGPTAGASSERSGTSS